MFTEILRILPVIDRTRLASMDRTLSKRFVRVARTFGNALKFAIKGTVFGIGLQLLASLLNPLKELEDRIKTLLGRGADITEQADRFGTTPGELERVRAVSESIGVTPERLEGLMGSFAKSVETARDELAQGKELSEASRVVRQFAGDKNIADSFFRFLQDLNKHGQASGIASRQQAERIVFGETQFGAARKLIEADFASEFSRIGNPSAQQLSAVTGRLDSLAARQRALDVSSRLNDFVRSGGKLTPGIIEKIEARADAERKRQSDEINKFDKLVKAAEGVQVITDLLGQLKDQVLNMLGVLTDAVKFMKDVFNRPAGQAYKNGLARFYSAIGADFLNDKGK